ncbi:MAG: 2-oxo acid dehydrogenase subunit E2 [Leptolinea sp.]|nr:2-oxo acid dehydrogenase subunit E2 [Leptolinea sp.]
MAETVTMPKLGFDMAEGTLVRWIKSEGEIVNKGDPLAEIETDKATVEVESAFSGVIHRRLVEEGTVVPVGLPIAIIASSGEQLVDEAAVMNISSSEAKTDVQKKDTEIVEQTESVQLPATLEIIKASPLAKRIAREFSISLDEITGSGPGGRIVKRDVENAVEDINNRKVQSFSTGKEEKGSISSVLPTEFWQIDSAETKDEHIPLSRLRAAIARRMVEAKQAPHFYITREFDMAGLMKLRKELNDFLPEEDRLSVNDFIVKATALTLRQFPGLNASYSETEIIQHGDVNIGVAVALDSGLMTVVCRKADIKPLRRISTEIREMAARARAGKVKPEDIEGSTFSISNLGMYDVENFAAIINPPETAILAVSSIRQVPVVVDGSLAVGSRMKATLSADHRVTDGAEAAIFLQKLAIYLEKPASLML